MNKINEQPTRDWFRILSPAVLASALSVIGIFSSYADMKSSQGWSFLGVIMLMPVVIILLTLDFVIKLVIRVNTAMVWLTEIIVIGFIFILWIRRF